MPKLIPILAFICLVLSSCSMHCTDINASSKLAFRQVIVKERISANMEPQKPFDSLRPEFHPSLAIAPALSQPHNIAKKKSAIAQKHFTLEPLKNSIESIYQFPPDSIKSKQQFDEGTGTSETPKFVKIIIKVLLCSPPISALFIFHSLLIGFAFGLGVSILAYFGSIWLVLGLVYLNLPYPEIYAPIISIILALILIWLTILLAFLVWHSILAGLILVGYYLISTLFMFLIFPRYPRFF